MEPTALRRAVAILTSQSALAKAIGVSQGLIWQWLTGRRQLNASRCWSIETATQGQVRCEELRPDVLWRRDDTGQVTGYTVPVEPAETRAA